MRSRTPFAVLCMTPFLVSGAYAQFTPGHIFVSIHQDESCLNGKDGIIEIDPTTGQWSIFADADDGICKISGLRFTPDNRRLLCLNTNSPGTVSGSILSFSPDGTHEVILDGSDGLGNPSGGNGLAFDADGNLYVVDFGFLTILRFPADGSSSTVFADLADGVNWSGALDFAPNGDLFYIGRDAAGPIRITPEGVGSVFDSLPDGGISLVFDRRGILFVAAHTNELGTSLYRYDNGDPSTRRILATGFKGFKGHAAITLSPDETTVYLADQTLKVYAIDVNDGTTTVVADLLDAIVLGHLPHGIAVYAPNVIPAVSPWGIVATGVLLLFSGIVVLRRRTTPVCIGACRA